MFFFRLLILALWCSIFSVGLAQDGSGYDDDPYKKPEPVDPEMYSKEIQPLLKKHCFRCHGSSKKSGKIALHSKAAIRDSETVEPGRPDRSEMYFRITLEAGDKERMPPKGPGLTTKEVALVKKWMEEGAKFSAKEDFHRDDSDTERPTRKDRGPTREDRGPTREDRGRRDREGGGRGYEGYGDEYDSEQGGYGDDDGGYGADDREDPADRAPKPPENLAEEADLAFRQGETKLAMNRLLAQSLVSGGDAEQVLSKYRWFKELGRPALAMRWGIGVKYDAKSGFTGAPKPVGVDQSIPNLDSDSDSDDEWEIPVRYKNDALEYYTGKVGDEVVLRLQNRIERGDYGEVLKEQLNQPTTSEDDEFDDGGYGGASQDDGGYGAYSGGYGGSGRGGGDDDDDRPANEIRSIMPGVVMLGEHPTKKLLTMAQDNDLDMLLLFDIKIERNFRVRLIRNTTKLRLYKVSDGKMAASSGTIENIDTQRKMAKDIDDNPVMKQVDRIFSVVDKSYRAKEFPSKAQPKHAIQFVKNLLKDESRSSLDKLAEVRFYHSRKLLTDSLVAKAAERILPSVAKQIAAGLSSSEVKSVFESELSVAENSKADEGHDDDEHESDDEYDDDESESNERKRPRRNTFR